MSKSPIFRATRTCPKKETYHLAMIVITSHRLKQIFVETQNKPSDLA